MTFEITKGERPTVTRTSRSDPNPFEGHFPTAEKEALYVNVTGNTEGNCTKAAEKVQRLARAQANKDGYTARSVVETEAPKGNAKTWKAVVKVWSADRQHRPGAGVKNKNGNVAAATS